jgi:hypothetical protein
MQRDCTFSPRKRNYCVLRWILLRKYELLCIKLGKGGCAPTEFYFLRVFSRGKVIGGYRTATPCNVERCTYILLHM